MSHASTMSTDQHPVSLVLRVMPGPAATGVVIGQIEQVASGVVTYVRDSDDLAALVCRLVALPTEPTRRVP